MIFNDNDNLRLYSSAFQNLFLTYHYHNTKHVRVPLGTANINAYFQDTGLPGCFTGWQQPARQCCGNLQLHSCYFPNLMLLDDRGEPVFMFEQ